jgi:hypothetical protein
VVSNALKLLFGSLICWNFPLIFSGTPSTVYLSPSVCWPPPLPTPPAELDLFMYLLLVHDVHSPGDPSNPVYSGPIVHAYTYRALYSRAQASLNRHKLMAHDHDNQNSTLIYSTL